MVTKTQIKGAVVGSIIGDVVGVPYEFYRPSDIKRDPCTDMKGYGTYNMPKGAWSDDTSMILATIDSLNNKPELDYDDMIQRYIRWIRDAEYTQYNDVFDKGGTTYEALMRYPDKKALECGSTGERSNGNGSLMRIIPICIYVNNKDTDEQIEIINNVSSLTHAHKISKASCNIYNFIIQEVLNHPKQNIKTSIQNGISNSEEYYNNKDYDCFKRLYSDNFFDLDKNSLYSKGFTVHSLEVALYQAYNSTSYKQSILDTVNTAYDTDTNACICGGLTGLYYGYDKIPTGWIDSVKGMDYVNKLIDKFYEVLK